MREIEAVRCHEWVERMETGRLEYYVKTESVDGKSWEETRRTYDGKSKQVDCDLGTVEGRLMLKKWTDRI